jgi:hypothetical protein
MVRVSYGGALELSLSAILIVRVYIRTCLKETEALHVLGIYPLIGTKERSPIWVPCTIGGQPFWVLLIAPDTLEPSTWETLAHKRHHTVSA